MVWSSADALPFWFLWCRSFGFCAFTWAQVAFLWLTVCGLRTVALILNFASHPNLNFREIARLSK
jgi:hypothetical protein